MVCASGGRRKRRRRRSAEVELSWDGAWCLCYMLAVASSWHCGAAFLTPARAAELAGWLAGWLAGRLNKGSADHHSAARDGDCIRKLSMYGDVDQYPASISERSAYDSAVGTIYVSLLMTTIRRDVACLYCESRQ